MSLWGVRMSVRMAVAAVTVVVVGGLLAGAAVTQTPDREITLVAREMAFYQLGDPVTPNPVLRVRAGERVRVVLRNDDRGITHDFAVPELGVGLDRVDWNEDTYVTFTAPDAPGRYEYVCRPHAVMMRGVLVVQ